MLDSSVLFLEDFTALTHNKRTCLTADNNVPKVNVIPLLFSGKKRYRRKWKVIPASPRIVDLDLCFQEDKFSLFDCSNIDAVIFFTFRNYLVTSRNNKGGYLLYPPVIVFIVRITAKLSSSCVSHFCRSMAI